MSALERVDCDLCGSSRYEFVYERPDGETDGTDWYRVVECNDCGLGFVNPRPGEQAMGAHYADGYYDWLAHADQSERMEAEAAYLPPASSFPETPRLLDIGCGAGTFARHMAASGWEVAGVEPFCPIDIDDFPVHRTFLPEIDGLAGRFDAVTAWAVLEHVTSPMAYFRKAADVLKPGGLFVFLVTNFDSLSSKRLFKEDVPRHCHFFTRATVARYLDEVGMNLVSVRFDDDVYSLGSRGALNYLYCRYVLRRPYTWRDYPPSYPEYLERRGLTRSALSALRFALRHPVTAADRAFEPLVDRWQKRTGTYGIGTYVAQKPTAVNETPNRRSL
jgi:SAM-dependent methyltransferase